VRESRGKTEEGRPVPARLSRRAFLTGAAGVVAFGSTATWGKTGGLGMSEKFDLDRFIDDVKRANAEIGSQAAVDAVLERTVSEPLSVLRGLGDLKQAGIQTLYRAEDLTILNVIWAPLMVLLPHNHNMWASIGIYTGREDNIIWQRERSVVEAVRAVSLSEKEVFPLPDDAIHSVTNPIKRLTGAIHVYGGDFFAPGRSEWDPETLAERPFDIDAARASFREANERFKIAP
jgi:predicted metal-dependent enzyme (double-stranded beta helix superfamily)